MTYREKVLAKILEYEKQFDPVDQYEITDAIGCLYEEIRAIPEDDEVIKSNLLKEEVIPTDKLNPKFPYRMEKARWYLLFLWMEHILTDCEFEEAIKRLEEMELTQSDH